MPAVTTLASTKPSSGPMTGHGYLRRRSCVTTLPGQHNTAGRSRATPRHLVQHIRPNSLCVAACFTACRHSRCQQLEEHACTRCGSAAVATEQTNSVPTASLLQSLPGKAPSSLSASSSCFSSFCLHLLPPPINTHTHTHGRGRAHINRLPRHSPQIRRERPRVYCSACAEVHQQFHRAWRVERPP